MLVLSRRVQERILVAEQVEVVVLRVEGEKVVLGFNAPREVPIRRAEIPPLPPVEHDLARRRTVACLSPESVG